MRLVSLRIALATGVVAAMCLVVGPRHLAAQAAPAAPAAERFERLVARALDPSDRTSKGSPFEIVVERWSTDAESEKLHDALLHGGPDKLVEIIQHTRVRTGVVQVPGIQTSGARVLDRRSYILKYAHQITTPTGRHVIVAINEGVVVGKLIGLADLRAVKGPPKPEITLIDIRFGPDGKGIGKVAFASKVTYNEKTKTIELGNYDKEPVRLAEVKSEKFSGGFARSVGK